MFAGCTSMFPPSSSTTVTVRDEPGKNTEITGSITMWAQPITVELQSSDSSLFVTSTTQPATTTTDAQPTSTASQPTETAGPSTSSESSGLSTGAGIGVGVGVGVGGIAIFAALGLWLLRRRRNSRKSPTHEQPQPYVIAQERVKQEYPSELSTEGARRPTIHELSG